MLKKMSLFAFILLLSSEVFAETQRKLPVEKIGKNIGTYFEIPVSDLERAIKFYSSVFGCEFTRDNVHGNEMALFSFNGNAAGITGALAKGETYKPSTSGSLIYLSSENMNYSTQSSHALGACSGMGWSFVFHRKRVLLLHT